MSIGATTAYNVNPKQSHVLFQLDKKKLTLLGDELRNSDYLVVCGKDGGKAEAIGAGVKAEQRPAFP